MTEHHVALGERDGGQAAADPGAADVTFVGNATVLLRLGGFTVLTDPNFLHAGERAKLGGGLRSRRLKDPAMEIGDLPHVDLVVLSHHHGDHFDDVAARELRRDLPIVTTGHAAGKLARQGFTATVALETWEACTVSRGAERLRVTALPGRHGPARLAALLPDVMGSLLEVPPAGDSPGYRLYVTGDTLIHDDLREIPNRHPEIDCALVHLGGTKVLGILLTMDGAQGVELLRIVRPAHAMPIHVDDYTVQRSPLHEFTEAVARVGSATQVHLLHRGEHRPLPRGGCR